MAYQPRKSGTPEKVIVTPGSIQAQVPASNIAPDAITTDKIKDRTIKSQDLGPQSVRAQNIKDEAITEKKLGVQQVLNQHLDAGAIAQGNIADGAVDTDALQDEAITNLKVAPKAVTNEQIAPDAVVSILAADSVKTINIKDLQVTNDKVASNAVTMTKIKDNAVRNSELADDAVHAANIKDGDLTRAKFTADVPGLVPHRKTAPDFSLTDLTLDAGPQIDGLDLSAIVPEGAVAVTLHIQAVFSAGAPYFWIYTNSGDALSNVLQVIPTAGKPEIEIVGTIPIDADRLLDYLGVSTFTSLKISVIAWLL